MHVHVAFTPDESAAAPTGVVIDVIRATSTICQALATGYERVLCAAEVEDARALGSAEVTLGGERLGVLIEGFDLGNSPREYLTVRTPTLAMSTTNGTRAIVTAAERCERVLIASLLNLAAVTEAARAHGDDVAIFCAGVKGAFALDDSYVAGRIAERLTATTAAMQRRRRSGWRRRMVCGGRVSRLAQRPQPDQPRPGARGRHRRTARARACSTSCRVSSGCTASPRRSGRSGLDVQVAVVLFTRDLRVHDNPALTAALETAETVLPLFVLDEGIERTRFGAGANRRAFLTESLADLDRSLRRLGGALDVRRGDVVAETVRAAREVGATTVFASADVSPYAVGRERRLAAELDLRLVNGHFVVPAGEVTPAGGDHYQVFSAYHRAWSQVPMGSPEPTPEAIRLPPGLEPGHVPGGEEALLPGGERAGVERARTWLRSGSTATARAATTRSPPTRPRGSRPTSTSDASRRGRSPSGRTSSAALRSCGSSAGATSTPNSSSRGRGRRSTTSVPAATGGSTIPTGSPPGRRG